MRCVRIGPCLAVAVFFLSAVVLPAVRGADEPGGDVPRDDLGAATPEYQQAAFSKLMPDADVTKPPAGFDPVIWNAFVPQDNAMTPDRVALGRKLYFDKRLSDDGTVSCATCHDVTRGFTDQLPTSEGIGGQFGKRNAPTVLNAVLLQTMFWDGRSPTLDHQAMQPILNPVEMGMPDEETAMKAIRGDAEYQEMFKKAYGREMNFQDLGRAIGAFERTLVFVDSPFRRFLAGDTAAISAEAQAGWDLFNGKARCVACHPMSPSNPLGSDNRFHNIGVSARHQNFEELAAEALTILKEDSSEQKLDELAVGTDLSELGRFMVTRNRADFGAFRTPLILNIGITAPYMHDGSLATLWDVVDHYNAGGEANPFLDGGIEPLALTEEEIDQLVAFMFTLTDVAFADENQQQFDRQKALAAKERPERDEALATRKTLPFEDRVMGTKSTDQ
ncbi:MAG: cytochrome-c peroxidase [Planctomycetaceae bacterium]|nr:cytochrome-c peroxidase [Planctomycetaceae bacterium]